MHLQMRGKSRQWRAARDNALTPNQHASDMVWSLTAATSHAPEGAREKLVAATKTGAFHTRSTGKTHGPGVLLLIRSQTMLHFRCRVNVALRL